MYSMIEHKTSVHVAYLTDYATARTVQDSYLGRGKQFFIPYDVRTGSEAQLVSCSIDTEFFPKIKTAKS